MGLLRSWPTKFFRRISGGRIQVIIADDGNPYIWQGVQWNSYKLFFVRGSFWKGEVSFQDVIMMTLRRVKFLNPRTVVGRSKKKR